MSKEENDKLALKIYTVILSCETIEQRNTARRFAEIGCRNISRSMGEVNKLRLSDHINFYLGYLSCKLGIDKKLI